MSVSPEAIQEKEPFIEGLESDFATSNLDFARAYYLFATAKLKDTYNSQEIYAKYPSLTQAEAFHQIKALYDQTPEDEQLTRLFTSLLDTYIGNQLATKSDALQNKQEALTIEVKDLKLQGEDGTLLETIKYQDSSEWFKKIETKATREVLLDRIEEAYEKEIKPLFLELYQEEDKLLESLGYRDRVLFHIKTSRHNLPQLARQAKQLIEETERLYLNRVEAFYKERTGLDFQVNATRADISYVFHGKDPKQEAINARFPEENLLALSQKTFDTLGLDYSTIAKPVDFPSLDAYQEDVAAQEAESPRILLDIAKRSGKRSRAFVYPAKVPSEIYLSVKPEGGLDDFSAFFHESGHALHFAYTDPKLPFSMALMGNNTVTETYAYLKQNLFLNRHWLEHVAGLSGEEALQVVRRGALNDLYMLRRYGSKLRFELELFNGDGQPYDSKAPLYEKYLTEGTGFRYKARGWVRDVDSGFYVADYFTAWALEASLRSYLCKHYGTPDLEGEDWYTNPKAGAFLKGLWAQGNLNQHELAEQLGLSSPGDVEALLTLMRYNLEG